mgnify:CR=1 FL=1
MSEIVLDDFNILCKSHQNTWTGNLRIEDALLKVTKTHHDGSLNIEDALLKVTKTHHGV